MNQHSNTAQSALHARLLEQTDQALNPARRWRDWALLMAATLASAVILALLLGEEGLLMHTRLSFTVLLLIGLGWVVYAGFALSRRHLWPWPQRVVSAWMALIAITALTLGALLGGPHLTSGSQAWMLAEGASLMLLAVVFVMHAHQRHRELRRLKAELEAALSEPE